MSYFLNHALQKHTQDDYAHNCINLPEQFVVGYGGLKVGLGGVSMPELGRKGQCCYANCKVLAELLPHNWKASNSVQ